jgi:hypothetical protein
VWARRTGRISRVSLSSRDAQINGGTPIWIIPAISATGRVVTFESSDPHVVRRDTNGHRDVFVRIRWGS